MGGGYQGPGTIGPPREALQAQLEALRTTGAPQHGAAGSLNPGWLAQAVPAPGLPGPEAEDVSKWQSALPPDLPRAAPEIYNRCRGAGANSIREWLSQNYRGEKSANNPVWIQLWDDATVVDFEVSRVKNLNELRNLLGTSDSMEIALRNLASEEYLNRTGDMTGANEMLAIKAPGVSTDLAPTWLVTAVTAHSKAEHQRNERVRAAQGFVRGQGRGRGRGGRGGGSQQQQTPNAAGDNQQARGRNRGRRGR